MYCTQSHINISNIRCTQCNLLPQVSYMKHELQYLLCYIKYGSCLWLDILCESLLWRVMSITMLYNKMLHGSDNIVDQMC